MTKHNEKDIKLAMKLSRNKIERILDCIYYELGESRLQGALIIREGMKNKIVKSEIEKLSKELYEKLNSQKPINNFNSFFVITSMLENWIFGLELITIENKKENKK